jgi:hypothetical protein
MHQHLLEDLSDIHLTLLSRRVWNHAKRLLKPGTPVRVHEIGHFDKWARTFMQLQSDHIKACFEFSNHDSTIIRMMIGRQPLKTEGRSIGDVLAQKR